MLASRNHLNPSKNNKANSSAKTDRKKEKQIKKAKEENPKHIKVKKTKQCDNNEDFEWSLYYRNNRYYWQGIVSTKTKS